jgi:PAS domain S-box-containing protein
MGDTPERTSAGTTGESSGAVAAARRLVEQERTLRGVLRAGAVVLAALTVAVSVFGSGTREAVLVYGTGVALHVGHLVALRTGRVRAVAISHCVLYLVWITWILGLRTGGLRAPAALVYPPLVLLAGLVWSGRAAVGLAIAGSACGGLLVWLEKQGLLPPGQHLITPLMLWMLLTACMVITAVILRFALNIIHRSTDDALQSQERFADLVRAAPDAMLFATASHVVRACNPAAEALTGRAASELNGRRLDDVVGVGEDERRRLARSVATALEGPGIGAADLSLRRPGANGSTEVLPVELRARYGAFAAAGEVHVTLRDLRDRLNAETSRRRLEEQLRDAQRLEALGRLAGGVAHDLNNLLTVVLGNVDLLKHDAGRRDEPMAEIQVAAERAAALTRQLLAFGRRQMLNAAIVDLGEVVTGLQPFFRRLVPEDVVLRVHREPDSCTISGDPSQLEQVVLNLVANARDALTGGGTITMSVSRRAPETRRHELDLPPEAVWLTVTDDGAGMSDEVMAHMFEPFFTTKEPARGTGLGLATVHGVVSQSGGRIFVDSAVGAGTTFAVVFPRAEGPSRVTPRPHPDAARAVASATVLLVEDEPAVRNVANAILASAGYRVIQASGGSEAVAVGEAFEGPIDLLLTDVVMQGQSGPSVARRLRVRRPELRVLYTSGHAEDLIAQKGVLRAGVHFLSKPFTRSSLLDKVREVLASPERGDLGLETAPITASSV